ncbi:MAG: hypothetical protein IT431_15485 [Phycisphaerales bacterium]|nr:hypothetical protein [Phycisphaerales bacterium]
MQNQGSRVSSDVGRGVGPRENRDLATALGDGAFVRSILRRCTRFGSDGEEVASETLLRLVVLFAEGKYEPDRGSVEAVSYGVMVRVARGIRRRRRQEMSLDSIEERPAAEGSGPLAIAEARELFMRITQGVEGWTRADRALLFRASGLGDPGGDAGTLSPSERSRRCRLRGRLVEQLGLAD